jgi:fatty-acyl-CoA synthase
MDENDRIVEKGQAGEVCVRGYSSMIGYWDDPAETGRTVNANGWLHMGLVT